MDDPGQDIEPKEDIAWEPDPLPLMVKHPPRITTSNTKIQLMEGALGQPCPKGENDLGWGQLQRKSLLWQEMIEGSSVITNEGNGRKESTDDMGRTVARITVSEYLGLPRDSIWNAARDWGMDRRSFLGRLAG